MQPSVGPDEAVFRSHLATGRFLSGVAARRWRLVSLDWPYAVFYVRAADGVEYGLQFECHDYPRTPVTGQLWDIEANEPLTADRWPTGTSRIPLVFNPGWKGGACLYLPCDCQAIEGHANWYQEHPALVWDPAIGIVHYLRIVSDLLNSGDYGGRRVT